MRGRAFVSVLNCLSYTRLYYVYLQDLGQSWDTPNPDFSLCFEKTVLVWGPCLLLWILSPIEIYLMMISKCRDIPWGFTNTAKLILPYGITAPPHRAAYRIVISADCQNEAPRR
ncbi:Canalicular multispecific organic anion transporter 1 [Homalodisca vitripennis]|nr:Canalicular multispecific organic anion transporter 1 [Homalodisca vitripennis]